MGEQGLSVSGEIAPLPRGELGRKKNVSREGMSENETRDGALFVSWGVHFQVEKTKSRCFLCFLALVFLGYFISSLPAFPQSLPLAPSGEHCC